jgi:hypothetical protein
MTILVVDDEADVQPMFLQRFRKEIRNNELEFGIRCTKLLLKAGAPIWPPMDHISFDQLTVEKFKRARRTNVLRALNIELE